MRSSVKFLANRFGPHFDRARLTMQLVLSPLIGAGAMLLLMAGDSKFDGINFGFAAIAGAVMGLMAGLWLAWNDVQKRKRAMAAAPPRPWSVAKIVVCAVLSLVGFFVLIAIYTNGANFLSHKYGVRW